MHSFAPGHRPLHDKGFAVHSNVREVWLEFVANSGYVGVNGVGFDVVRHVCDVETEGVGSGVCRESVVLGEFEIRFEG